MTELIWEGKYDNEGKRVAPLRVSLPFQTIETVNESAQDRQRSFDLFRSGRDAQWRNRLIWGDKKYVLPALLDEFSGQVDLIYIDPPFATGADFSFQLEIAGQEFTKEPSVIEQKAYRDTWGRGLDSYLAWTYETAIFLRELLKNTGSLYVHLGSVVVHPVKLVLDEVFGADAYAGQVIWHYRRWTNVSGTFQQMHDVILYYVKGPGAVFNQTTTQPTASQQAVIDRGYNVNKVNARGGKILQLLVYDRAKVDEAVAEGRLDVSKYGRVVYRDSQTTTANDVWTDIQYLHSQSLERTGYATQKPEPLLERLIEISSNAGDLVADFFCGSGTTPVVAEKLGRRWLAGDLGRFAVHTTRKRLLATPNVSPFVVQNLGKYERQIWQAAEFGEQAEKRTAAYRSFILDLYRAEPVQGYAWLHGVKQGRMVHVSTVDAPVTVGDVKQIATEFRRAIGSGEGAPAKSTVDVLGWDFAFEVNEVARQDAGRAGIDMRFVRIPREVLDKKAVDQGDIRFFELAALSVDVKQTDRDLAVTITDFVIPLDDVPEDIQGAITSWIQWNPRPSRPARNARSRSPDSEFASSAAAGPSKTSALNAGSTAGWRHRRLGRTGPARSARSRWPRAQARRAPSRSASFDLRSQLHRSARTNAVSIRDRSIDLAIPPSGTGCVECLATGGWWFHLRRCVHCGHIGCCDQSPSQHTSKHAAEEHYPIIRSFEPDEDWFYDYDQDEYGEGPELAPPLHHPLDQPTPGPAGFVPLDWESHLH